MITANSFMKREFGKKLIEEFLPRVDLTHVIDTSGASIPGHGTPTVILFGRDRKPVAGTIRTAMGIKGEPSPPDDPAQGLVWQAIVGQLDRVGSESAFVSVADTPRTTFGKHPWSIGGGGVGDLVEVISGSATGPLATISEAVGRTTHTGEDNVFSVPPDFVRRFAITDTTVGLVDGDQVRDYLVSNPGCTIFPYDKDTAVVRTELPDFVWRHFWCMRRIMKNRMDFGNYIEDRGLRWYEHSMFFPSRYRQQLGIAFADIATHNHFVLDRGGKVFNRTAPVIKLPVGASESEHLGLVGLLNSSVACFWLQQVCHNKGGPGGGSSKDEKWHDFYAFNATKIAQFPLIASQPLDLAQALDQLAQELASASPAAVVGRNLFRQNAPGEHVGINSDLHANHLRAASLRRQMIAWQEELDWRCYRLYGLTEDELTLDSLAPVLPLPPGEGRGEGLPEIALGERAFEIVMARRMAAGTFHTSWFEWLKIKPVTEVPARWPDDYRQVVEARIALIENDKFIGLIESPNCKRRWETSSWEEQEKAALKSWLLDRLEDARYRDEPATLMSTHKLADRARQDAQFMDVAEVYTGRADFDVAALVSELVTGEAVPLLPSLRYTEAGLRKRAEWEKTWALQRREDTLALPPLPPALSRGERENIQGQDEGPAPLDIPVPPKYKSVDFLKSDFWRLRGGLDVPKERFVSFPHCARDADGSLVVAWAGFNPLQLGTAIAAHFIAMKEDEGWDAARLTPLLAGIQELLPWILQWHNAPDPDHGTRMGDYLAGFIEEEARSLGLTLDALKSWQAPVSATARRGRKAK